MHTPNVPKPLGGKRALPGYRCTRVHITLDIHDTRIFYKALRKNGLKPKSFWKALLHQAIGARLPLVSDLDSPPFLGDAKIAAKLTKLCEPPLTT